MEQQVSDENSCQENIALTDEQKKIINSSIDEDQRILACAGSGKTTTLIYRIKYLIEQGICAKQILLSTFNVEAANNLKIKAKQVLQQDAEEVKMMNIDKFNAEIYNKYIKDNDKDNNFKLDIKELGYKVQQFLSTREGNEKVLKKYKYFFFDEFQDVNQIQYDILILFKKAGCKIIVIGDEAQNIYSFRDSKLEFIQSKINQDVLEISKQEIKTYHLSVNFRCSRKITSFCNQIFANQKHLARPMDSLKNEEEECYYPKISLYGDQNKQVYDLISTFKGLIQQGYQWSDLAVLSPSRKPLLHFQEYLEQHYYIFGQKIPYSLISRNIDNLFTSDNFESTEKQNHLTLSTIHSSKGLEWKVVFIIGINDFNFPGAFIKQLQVEKNIQEKLNECRRLFYVACTRAMEQLKFCFLQYKEKYICRFFSEINKQYYQSDQDLKKEDFAQIQSKQKNQVQQRNLQNPSQKKSTIEALDIKNKIADIIQNFDINDYEVLNSFLQKIKLLKYQRGEHVTFDNEQIKQNALQQDLICYLEILLYRSVVEKFLQSQTIQNEDAEKIILRTISWSGYQKSFYNRYKDFFNQLDFQKLDSLESFIDNFKDFNKIEKKLNRFENENLSDMYSSIQKFLKQYKLNYKDIHHATETYFSDDFDRQKYFDSYQQFSNKELKTQNILKDIYNVSKFSLISQGIKRSLYRDDSSLFHNEDLTLNIDRFLNVLEQQYDQNRFEIKKKINYANFYGVIDLIAFDKSLAYACILKKMNYRIQNIVFYNVLQDNWIIYSIEQWNQEEEFLRFLQKKKEDYQKEQEESEETDNNLEKEKQQQVKIQEKSLQNLQVPIEEQEKENNSKNINNYSLQESQQEKKNQLIYQINCQYSQNSIQNQSQNSDQTVQENNLQHMYKQNDQQGNIDIENQFNFGNQSKQNDNLIQVAFDNQKINQNEPLENKNNLFGNFQQIRDDTKKIEEPRQQLINLKNHVGENSQVLVNSNQKGLKKSKVENQKINLNQKRKKEKDQVDYEQQKINFKKQKVEQGEKSIFNIQIIFLIIYILFQIIRTTLKNKEINS
ncbi:UvrD/REP helicase family protein (macronuclear) [Tetrahymena thermophila SB210]|uniref:DNA 3'-5' helicase n=1 Tax=Tetrahymena thermophila (strain SB210) TaxID=312017 RepID=I7MJ97_TETTS|nr:UvrD/REP helicase family protein [Tetrahymena thermophila SB210]EAR96101.2 UvrD/REP helicase family protein [Tetrahymena thermophila SB210]|eukprot:XP_001016346.2 UvrD/REP helicase family protein [Tetrahymena thermophila SB210]